MTTLETSPLHSGLLAAVSRSFYLSLRVLPAAVRGPLSLGYLLARAADTIADVPARPASERLALLAALERGEAAEAAAEFANDVPHEGERVLLRRLGECFAALHGSAAEDAALIRTVLARIIRGQSLDLARFPGILATAHELDEYTWLVAGCVGEFWTEVCVRHLPHCATLPRQEMVELGTQFGKGLQLVNILRDQPRDMAEGRCYLPVDDLRGAGLTDFSWPAADWHPWHAVRRHWLRAARERLAAGRTYAAALTVARLRFAALLPLLIGEATLDLLEAQPADRAPEAAKISRGKVKRLMLRALWQSVR